MVCVLVYPEVCLVSIVQMINEGRGLCRFNSVTRLKKTPFKFSHKSNSLDFLAPPFLAMEKGGNLFRNDISVLFLDEKNQKSRLRDCC